MAKIIPFPSRTPLPLKECLKVLHLMTQEDQPFGSTRRCCEVCRTMIWGPIQPYWTYEPETFQDPPEGFTNCY